ncbi:hypothetical protein J2T17_005272 [Paenibacillus mucilaginosus]|uniref:hypothetical protein n=1 Tax=Paenibacillus mucilaginosus TaxID=61624 RepID=UPI003D1C7690
MMKSAREETTQLLKEMDGQFGGFFEWLEEQYDPATGGFFYARSSKESGRFTPDIESTSQAINIMERVGLLEGWDAELKAAAVRFYQSKQDPTGYFYDADPNMKDDEVMVGRAIGYSSHALAKLGAEPLYPLPGRSSAAPDYMATPETYARWLQSIELVNSWRGCDRLCNSAPYIFQMNEAERAPYLQEAFGFFERIQDRESGLWGEGSLYVQISGTFKLHTFYNRFGVPMPRVREMYASILRCLRTEEAFDMCYIRNPINLLHSMKLAIPPEEMREITEITLANMKRLKHADGGFSRELGHSPTAPNVAQVKANEFYPDMPKAVHLGLGLAEGDMNAGTQAILIRWLCYELAGLPVPPLELPEGLFAKYGAVR